jgi:hypothetical protein
VSNSIRHQLKRKRRAKIKAKQIKIQRPKRKPRELRESNKK